jgi:undecaprenyl-diphosphatase
LTNWLFGILLGLVQGISEWLPVSSKTQVIFVSNYLYGFSFQQAYALGLFLEAGTFVAAVVYFRREVYRVLLAIVGKGDAEGKLLLKYLVIVTLVTAVIGVAIYKVAESISGPVVGVPMIFLGVVLLLDATLIAVARRRPPSTKGLSDLTLREMLLIGVAQGIAALPGVSRSGATVSAMLLLGIRPSESFRLSFIALIPASIGATLVTLIFSSVQISSTLAVITTPVLAVAIITAIVVGLISIRLLLRVASASRIVLLVAALGIIAVGSGIVSLLVGAG